jgi:hypothetical protein
VTWAPGVWVPSEGRWEWKDRELLEQRVREGRFTEEQTLRIRAEAERVAQELDAGERWWSREGASWDWARWSPG